MMLHTKYRPQRFADVIGQDAAVKSLERLFETGDIPHAFLFCGPSGVGKTTLARIIGKELEAEVREFDAATTSSVQDIRSLVSQTHYKSLFSKAKLYIIDECHALSKSAWQAFLKTIEEPPEHVYFAFCTTEDNKVPKTVKTRCHTYTLNDVPARAIEDYLFELQEETEVGPGIEEAVSLIAKESHGSVRQALVYMSMADGVQEIDEVERILQTPGSSVEVIDLCRSLFKRERLETIIDQLKALDEQGMEAESIRIVIVNYMKSVYFGSKGKKAADCIPIMECFSRRCDGPDGMALFCLCLDDLYGG